MKNGMVKVRLFFPSIRVGRPDKATAEALARETKTLWIVRREHVVITNNPGNIRFGYGVIKFRKSNGRGQGQNIFTNGWRCAGRIEGKSCPFL